MMLCDTNVWLALVLSRHQHYHVLPDWIETIGTPRAVCSCRAMLHSLLRLLTAAAGMQVNANSSPTNRQA